MKFKTKITLLAIVPVILSLLVFTFISIKNNKELATETSKLITSSLSNIYRNYLETENRNVSEKISMQFKQIMTELKIFAGATQTLMDDDVTMELLSKSLQETPYFKNEIYYNEEKHWSHTKKGTADVSTSIYGYLHDAPGKIKKDTLDFINKTAIFKNIMIAIQKYGVKKSWVYMVGPKKTSVLMITPWVEMPAIFDEIYPGYNEKNWWDFFYPGMVETWQVRIDKKGYTNIKGKEEIFLTPLYFDAGGTGWMISFFHPIWDKGRKTFRGAVAIDYGINDVIEMVQKEIVGKTGFAFIAQDNGNILGIPSNGEKILGIKFEESVSDKGVKIEERLLSKSQYQEFANLKLPEQDKFQINSVAANNDKYLVTLSRIITFNVWLGQEVEKKNFYLGLVIPEKEIFAVRNQTNQEIAKKSQSILYYLTYLMGILLILILLFVFRMTIQVTRGIYSLSGASKEIAKGNYNILVEINSKDEIAELSETFNSMSKNIMVSHEKLRRTASTFEKFVPKQFLNRIAKSKEGIENIELGVGESDHLAILFSDIRSFTALSETLTPQELLNFLNAYFVRMNEPIHKQGGFIDKFIGDAIMALFDSPDKNASKKVEAAVLAAIGMQKSLYIYNQHRQKSHYQPIAMGIGVHYGPTIIGTVGSKDRMDSTILGDSVNLAARLEGLTKVYGASIIISDAIYSQLENPHNFKIRELDWVKVKGKTVAVKIYEVFDQDEIEVQQLKQKVNEIIVEGLIARKEQDWSKSQELFEQALKVNPHDIAVKLHYERCLRMQHQQLSENWDGSIVLDMK